MRKLIQKRGNCASDQLTDGDRERTGTDSKKRCPMPPPPPQLELSHAMNTMNMNMTTEAAGRPAGRGTGTGAGRVPVGAAPVAVEALHDAAVAEAIFTISAGLHAVDIVDVDLETPPLSPQLTAMQKGQRYVSTNCAPMRQRPPRECGGRRSRPPTMRSRRRKYIVGLES